jgi:fumarate hydratase subunit alpha
LAVGGSFELAALEAKKALLRPTGIGNPDPEASALEKELLVAVNNTGVVPQGHGRPGR